MLNVNEIPHREALEEIVHKTSPETRIFLLKHIQKSWRVSFSHLLLSGLINPIFHRYPHIWQAKSEHHTKALTPRQVVAQLVLRSDMNGIQIPREGLTAGERELLQATISNCYGRRKKPAYSPDNFSEVDIHLSETVATKQLQPPLLHEYQDRRKKHPQVAWFEIMLDTLIFNAEKLTLPEQRVMKQLRSFSISDTSYGNLLARMTSEVITPSTQDILREVIEDSAIRLLFFLILTRFGNEGSASPNSSSLNSYELRLLLMAQAAFSSTTALVREPERRLYTLVDLARSFNAVDIILQ